MVLVLVNDNNSGLTTFSEKSKNTIQTKYNIKEH